MGTRSRWGGKAVVVVATVATLALTFSATAAFGAGAVPFKDAHFSGYATGTFPHVDALRNVVPDTTLADIEEAFTGAAVNSDGLKRIKNEMDREVTPAGADKNSQGRGSALEVGLVNAPPDTEPNGLILTAKSQSLAPPSTTLDTQEIAPLPANPLVYASLLRGQSQALWSTDQCIIGQDISFGRGDAADVQVLSTTLSNTEGPPLWDEPLLSTDSSVPDTGRTV